MEVTVDELVARARMHDSEAFAALIQRFEGIALSIAYAQSRNAADARDLVQECFLRAWQRLDTLDDPSRFGHWLGRMIRNLAIDWRRRRKPGQLDTAIDFAGEAPPAPPMERAEQKGQIDQALASLDEPSRLCVTLRYYEGLSSKQIAELLDLSPAAVDMRLSRARTFLRERLGTMSMED